MDDPDLYRSDTLVVRQVRPCAEDEHLLQLEGWFLARDHDAIRQSLAAAGWKVIEIGTPPTLVAKLTAGPMLLIAANAQFTLSRVLDVATGLKLLASFSGYADLPPGRNASGIVPSENTA